MDKISQADLPVGAYVSCARNITSGNMVNGRYKMFGIVKDKQELTVIENGKMTSTFALRSAYPFGEVISLVGEATNTAVVTVEGQDYLGQPMKEEITLNSATAVEGKKAFKVITKMSVPAAATTVVKLKTTNKVGCEFQTVNLDFAIVNGAKNTAIKLVAFANTQTATSADTRGVFDLSTLSAGDEVELFATATQYCKKNGEVDVDGGYYGVRQYF